MAVTTRIFVGVLVWEFVCIISLMIGNTIIGGYVAPIMYDAADNSTLVNGTVYRQQIAPVMSGWQIAIYVFMATPIVYLFVRLVLKREQTAPAYYPQGGFG